MKQIIMLSVVGVVVVGVSTPAQGFVGSAASTKPKPWIYQPAMPATAVVGISSAATVGARAIRYRRNIARMATVERIGNEGSVSELTFDAESWKKGYSTAGPEDQYLMKPSMGTIPKDIEGTLFQNCPAKYKIGEDTIKHLFDADGMILAASFSEEGAYFRNRYVKTKGYVRELKAGKQLYRGFYNIPGGILKNAFRIGRKNLANTSVISWAGNLLALWEGGLPYRLDGKSLETFGETRLGETIDDNRQVFTAHPRIDPKSNRLVGFGNINTMEATYYEYDEKFRLQDFRVLKEVAGLIHDFGVTEKYAIFYCGPIKVKPLKWVLGLETMADALAWEGDQRSAVIHIAPRDPSKKVKSIEVPARQSFHVANAYDDPETGEVVFDMVEADRLDLGRGADPNIPMWESFAWSDVPQTQLVRYRLNVSGDKASLVSTEVLYGLLSEFPSVNPKVSCQQHRYIFGQCGILPDKGSCPGQGVMKVDTVDGTVDKWLPESHEFAGEAKFIPRKGAPEDAPEDFGYLSTFVVNGRDQVTELVILDAQNVSKGPVCRLPLKEFAPHTLHGFFDPEAVFTPDQVEKSFELSDLFARKGWNVAKSEFSGLGLNSLMD